MTSRCADCGISLRIAYGNGKDREACKDHEKQIYGIDPITNQPFTHVTWRRTRCKHCGGYRTDKFYSCESPVYEPSSGWVAPWTDEAQARRMAKEYSADVYRGELQGKPHRPHR